MAEIGWTTEALEQHLAEKARARRRMDQELRRSSAASPRPGKRQKNANRAASKRAWKNEVFA